MNRCAAALACLLAAAAASAHEPSRSLLTLAVDGGALRGRWEISLRDLEDAVGLDADGDSSVTWGELVARDAEVTAYALPRLRVFGDDGECGLVTEQGGVNIHGGAAFAVLELNGGCASAPRVLRVDYELLFDVDRAHRGIVTLESGAGVVSGVVSAERRRFETELERVSAWSSFARFAEEGVRHIWAGYDHLAFVGLLLLPILLGRGAAVRRNARAVAGEVVRVVTAFTVAHSVTLLLAARGYVPIPTRAVELVIALSVLLAAVLNVVPNLPRLGTKLAFGFGLVHGFGFASALGDLVDAKAALLVTLAGFNVGVELGQLAVVAVLVPLLLAVRACAAAWQNAVNLGGSAACGGLAIVWLAERWA